MIDTGKAAASSVTATRWCPSAARRWTLNSDAAVPMKDGRWGMGVVTHGKEGEFKATVACE